MEKMGEKKKKINKIRTDNYNNESQKKKKIFFLQTCSSYSDIIIVPFIAFSISLSELIKI